MCLLLTEPFNELKFSSSMGKKNYSPRSKFTNYRISENEFITIYVGLFFENVRLLSTLLTSKWKKYSSSEWPTIKFYHLSKKKKKGNSRILDPFQRSYQPPVIIVIGLQKWKLKQIHTTLSCYGICMTKISLSKGSNTFWYSLRLIHPL